MCSPPMSEVASPMLTRTMRMVRSDLERMLSERTSTALQRSPHAHNGPRQHRHLRQPPPHLHMRTAYDTVWLRCMLHRSLPYTAQASRVLRVWICAIGFPLKTSRVIVSACLCAVPLAKEALRAANKQAGLPGSLRLAGSRRHACRSPARPQTPHSSPALPPLETCACTSC